MKLAAAYRSCLACPNWQRGGVCALTSEPVRFSRGAACPDGRWSIDGAGRSVLHRALEFVATVTSGRAEPDVIAARLATCDSCDQLERVGERRYCRACSCPHSPLSELSRKLAFADAKCPLGRFP